MPEVAERSTVEILRAARERISPENQWSNGAFARNRIGRAVPPYSVEACRWCAVGSLIAESDISKPDYYRQLRDMRAWVFLQRAAATTPEGVNDAEGHGAVLALYDRAIQLAEQEAS